MKNSEINFKVKVSDELTKKDLSDMYKWNLVKLQWYIKKGWSKESLIIEKIFAKSFIEKNYK